MTFIEFKRIFASSLLFLVIFPSFLFAGNGGIPWKKGDAVGDAWKVAEVIAQQEFVRLVLRNGEKETTVEIAQVGEAEGEWVTEYYRVQPAPGQNPPEAVLKIILDQLKKLEETTGYEPFITRVAIPVQKADSPVVSALKGVFHSVPAFIIYNFILFGVYLLFFLLCACLIASAFKKSKTAVFGLVTFFPIFLLSALIVSAVIRIIQINMIPPEESIAGLEARLETKKGQPMSFATVNGEFGYFNPYSWYDFGEDVFIPFDPDPYDCTIYVFGGSSVGEPGDKGTFAHYLEELLNESGEKKIRVFNFGMNGYDSYSIRNRLATSIYRHKPDLAIIYSGHNDYIDQYFFLKSDYAFIGGSPVLNFCLKVYYFGFYRSLNTLLDSGHFSKYERFLDYLIEPTVMRFLFETGIVRVGTEMFEKADDVILKYFDKNMRACIEATSSKGVPLLFITPVCNLEAEPSGPCKTVSENYQRGIEAGNYQDRVDNLIKAKDGDAFSYEIRAKSALNEHLRGLSDGNVFLLDLERELIADEFSFDYNAFQDYIHMHPATHKIIADRIFRIVKEKRICCESD